MATAPSTHTRMSTEPLLRLLQLSSSLCPIGAFAYSQGLENAVEQGWIESEAELLDWLSGVGEHGLAALDLPLLLRAHRAWHARDIPAALRLAERVLANREAREPLEQEQRLGGALAAVLENLGVPRPGSSDSSWPASYVVVYALGAAHFAIPAEQAARGYSFAWAEQQVNAAARLGLLGHMGTQRVLSAVLERVPDWIAAAGQRKDEEIGSCLPAQAMAAAWHETQYTRLFRS